MKDYTIFNGRKLSADIRQELEKKHKEIKELKEENKRLIKIIDENIISMF